MGYKQKTKKEPVLPLSIKTAIPTLLWRHNGHEGVSNHQPHECLFNRPSRRRSKKTSKLRVTGLCAGNSAETGEFPAQMVSNAEMFPFDDVIMRYENVHVKARPSYLQHGDPYTGNMTSLYWDNPQFIQARLCQHIKSIWRFPKLCQNDIIYLDKSLAYLHIANDLRMLLA